jgi:surfactin synthase thioesterase subunit
LVALVGGSLDATNTLFVPTVVADVFVRRKWKLAWCGLGSGLAGETAKTVHAKGGKAEALVVAGKEPYGVPGGARRHKLADFHERGRVLFE